MAKLNYATEYLQTLEQMFPYVLYFGDLFATPQLAVPMETETPLEPESVTTTTSGNR